MTQLYFYRTPEVAAKLGLTMAKFQYLHKYLPVRPIVTNGGGRHIYLWPGHKVDRIGPMDVQQALREQKARRDDARAKNAAKARAVRKVKADSGTLKKYKKSKKARGFVRSKEAYDVNVMISRLEQLERKIDIILSAIPVPSLNGQPE